MEDSQLKFNKPIYVLHIYTTNINNKFYFTHQSRRLSSEGLTNLFFLASHYTIKKLFFQWDFVIFLKWQFLWQMGEKCPPERMYKLAKTVEYSVS